MASKQEKALMAQQAQLMSLMQQQIQKANTPDPNVEKLKGKYNSILDWYDPSNMKDIYKHPTIAAQINPLQVALSNRDANRVGTGVLGAKMSSQSAPYAKDLELERDFQRRLAGAGMLSNALQSEHRGAEEGLASTVGLDLNRQNSSNSLMGLMNSALDTSLQRERSKGSWWKSLLGGVASGASGALAAL